MISITQRIMNNILEIIEKKKNNIELSKDEIDFFVNGYVFKKIIPDYQMSSLLMAFRLNGMTDNEIYFLTKAFIETSDKYEFKKNGVITIDKHSSGGVGDKITLIMQPILMALGFGVTKISGRGLGHTGGTIDKLDSIGFNSSLSISESYDIFNKCHSVLLQQTQNLVPADKMFYALRDVTSTVDTLGLIVSSILSKKFVVNSDYIFLDLKVGSGAIFKTESEAKNLASKMIDVANLFNRKIFIHLTNMDSPLGNCIGNAIEVKEAIDFLLRKNINQNLENLVRQFTIDILLETKKANDVSEALKMYDSVFTEQKAFNEMQRWFLLQGVKNIEDIKNNCFFKPKNEIKIFAKKSGYIRFNSASSVGLIAMKLGAGRMRKEDSLDFQAGIFLNNISDTYFNEGDYIASLYSSNDISSEIINEFNSIIIYEEINNKKNVKMILSTLNN